MVTVSFIILSWAKRGGRALLISWVILLCGCYFVNNFRFPIFDPAFCFLSKNPDSIQKNSPCISDKKETGQPFDCPVLCVSITYLPGPSPDKYFRQKRA